MKHFTYTLVAISTLSLPACADETVTLPELELTPTPRAAKLYPDFPTDGIFPRVDKAESMPDPNSFHQPESLIEDLKAIQTGTLEERLEALKKKSISDQVFVKGGKFLMGDFGYLQSNEGLPWSANTSNKPLRKVTLSNFSISKYKITYAEFDLYSEVNNIEKVQSAKWFEKDRHPDTPAGITWKQAKNYCTWLATLTGRPFDLPTEAQWEYVARSRGYFIVWPTSDGTLTWDKNVPSTELFDTLAHGSLHPIGIFPKNPLGLYDLAHNGLEWMNDWYSETYYGDVSVAKDPQGPKTGTQKVLRSWTPSWDLAAMSFDRRGGKLGNRKPLIVNGLTYDFGNSQVRTARCSTSNPTPLSND